LKTEGGRMALNEIAKKELYEAIRKALSELPDVARKLVKDEVTPVVIPQEDNMISLDLLGETKAVNWINFKPADNVLIVKLE